MNAANLKDEEGVLAAKDLLKAFRLQGYKVPSRVSRLQVWSDCSLITTIQDPSRYPDLNFQRTYTPTFKHSTTLNLQHCLTAAYHPLTQCEDVQDFLVERLRRAEFIPLAPSSPDCHACFVHQAALLHPTHRVRGLHCPARSKTTARPHRVRRARKGGGMRWSSPAIVRQLQPSWLRRRSRSRGDGRAKTFARHGWDIPLWQVGRVARPNASADSSLVLSG